MKDFKFKTRGENPARKAKVYFSCHESDFGFFDEITDDILSCQDCAIYYLDDFGEIADKDDYYLRLQQMQLFVFPISAELLTSPSRAYDLDYAYAIEHSIPVLPIMLGTGLEGIFNEKFGTVQYLDKINADVTAISYKKKLSDLLSSVLVSDELAQKIREAFDAYVFLSYRKKDRRYANEVMRAIHSLDFARDIAIWFDEFLVAGEDFNEAISAALTKSDLFTLVVTPNIVNEDNYVMRVEYPAAKQEGKPILPVESVHTDPDLLKAKYENLPEVIDPNTPLLSEALIERLKGLAIRENDTPIHNYYIALAYLYGIDVEVNKQKAVDILNDCAKSGLIEAMEKLVELYTIGDGVKIDQAKALELTKKIIEHYLCHCETDEDKEALADNLVRCGKLTVASCDCDKRTALKTSNEYTKKALELYKELNNELKALNTYSILITQCTSFEEFDQLSFEGFEYAAFCSNDEQSQICIACFYKSVGMFYIKFSTVEQGAEYINQAVDIFKQYEDYSFDAKLHLVDIYVNIAELFEGNAEYEEASRLLNRAVMVSKKLTETTPLAYVLLARSYNMLGNLYYSHSTDYDIAENAFLECEKSLLALEKQSPVYLLPLVTVYSSLAGLYANAYDDAKKSENYLLRSMRLMERLAPYTELLTEEYVLEKKFELAALYLDHSMEKAAITLYLQILSHYKEKGYSDPSAVMSAYYFCTQAFAQAGEYEHAKETCNEALEFAKTCADNEECAEYAGCLVQLINFLPRR